MAYQTNGITDLNSGFINLPSKYTSTWERFTSGLNASNATASSVGTLLTSDNQGIVIGQNTIGVVALDNGKKRYTILGQDVTSAAQTVTGASTSITTSAVNVYNGVSGLIGQAASFGASQINQMANSQIGGQIGDTLKTFGGNLFSGNNTVEESNNFNIDAALGINGGLGNAAGTQVSDAAKAIGNAANVASKEVKQYIAPVTETIEAIYKIGDEFDKIIKDTFLGQMFNIKGSEILCALFCIIISLLPCSTRQELYDALVAIRQGIKTANATIDAISNMTKTPVEVPLFNEKSIADNIKNLFPAKFQGTNLNKALGTSSDSTTKKPAIPLTLPPDVLSIVNNVVMVLSILAKGQITIPVGFNGTIWTFAQAVLAIIQAMVIQAVDEFLTKIVKDIEKSLKKMMPQICIGNMASKFINRIINALKSIKAFLLAQIKMMLGDMNGFGIKWKTFGWYFKEIQELLAMLKALQLILKKFPELALSCGISPCNQNPSPEIQDITDAINNGQIINETNEPANILPLDQTPQGKTLDDLVSTFQTMTNNPNTCVLQTQDGFCVMMPDMFKDAPSQIRDIALSPEFLASLGSAYTVFANQNVPGINIVYTYKIESGVY
jgi:hypothetical protein